MRCARTAGVPPPHNGRRRTPTCAPTACKVGTITSSQARTTPSADEGGQLVAHGRARRDGPRRARDPALLADVTEPGARRPPANDARPAGRLPRAAPAGPVPPDALLGGPGRLGGRYPGRGQPAHLLEHGHVLRRPAAVPSVGTDRGRPRRPRSQERRVVGDTPRRRARDPVVTPASTGRAAAPAPVPVGSRPCGDYTTHKRCELSVMCLGSHDGDHRARRGSAR